MMRIGTLFVSGTLLLIAQEGKKLSQLEQLVQPKISFQSDYISNAKFDGYKGSVKTYKQKIQVNNDIVGVSYSRWHFDWNKEKDLPFYTNKTPIDSMQSIRLFANLPIPINDKWFMLNMLNVNSTFEKEMSGSYGAGFASFFSYKFNKDHAILLGAFANYHRVKTRVLPVLGYTYRARAKDGVQMVLAFPHAYIGYHVSPELLLNAGVVYSQAVIRLADDSGIAPKGYIEAKDFLGNIGVRYEFSKNFELSADLLYAFKRDFTIYKSDTSKVDIYTIKPSAGGTLKLKYTF